MMLKKPMMVILFTVFVTGVLSSQPDKTATNKPQPENQPQPSGLTSEADRNTYDKADKVIIILDTTPWFKQPLVVVGIITFFVIGWQSWETRKSAGDSKIASEAALKQANYMVASERPWVLVSIKGHSIIDEDLGDEKVKHSSAFIVLTNYGRGPAFIRDVKCGAFLCKFPSDVNESLFDKLADEYQSGNIKQLTLPPGAVDDSIRVISQDVIRSVDFRTLAPDLIRIYCGIIRYDDPYGKNRETRFCLMLDRDKWRIMGTLGMNDCR